MDLGAEEWETLKVDAMALALAVKLAQHPTTFGAGLLATKELHIVEKSHRDPWWGAKPTQGELQLVGVNVLGQLLTQLRRELQRRTDNPAPTELEAIAEATGCLVEPGGQRFRDCSQTPSPPSLGICPGGSIVRRRHRQDFPLPYCALGIPPISRIGRGL